MPGMRLLVTHKCNLNYFSIWGRDLFRRRHLLFSLHAHLRTKGNLVY